MFRETTNPPVATGDGVALAFHAGARVADLEFVQFHPTALNRTDAPRFLISEALRGEGARLVNERGEPFLIRHHPDGDLAPRDVVARSIAREAEQTGGAVFLTLAHLDPSFVHTRFPTITEMCRRLGLDLARDPIPVGPAAHYIMGGSKPTNGEGPRSPDYLRQERLLVQASMGPIDWPATRCSRGWSSVRARRLRCSNLPSRPV